MKFNLNYLPHQSTRFPVVANNGMVCTGSSLAAAAGLDILKKGGNAIDAAIATAAALTVVEPTANGIGSDAFAIVWYKDEMYGLNGSGYAPKKATKTQLLKHPDTKDKTIAKFGWTPITVPGTPKSWAALSKRFGKLSLLEALQPAIDYAEEGFPISPALAKGWNKTIEVYSKMKNEPFIQEWFKTFTINGFAPKAGEIMYLPNHAKALRSIAATASDSFYTGEIADDIDRLSKEHNGFLRKDDLKEYDVEWVKPISLNYRGYDVWEIPPNGQGIVALMALNIMKEFVVDQKDPLYYHRQFEAIKLAFKDAIHYISDPKHMTVDYQQFINPDYGRKRSLRISEIAKEPNLSEIPNAGTVYLCTADKEGNMVSYIQSNYMGFGSGVVVDDWGISLQNRGTYFSLDSNHVNCIQPRKRTYHTIIPGFITKKNRAVGPFGIMGGRMQPQAHLQVMMNLIDFHENPQAALDAPRWQWQEGMTFLVEKNFDTAIALKLKEYGHDVRVELESGTFGRGEMIIRLENGVYVGGCESRTDGSIASW